MPTIQNAAAEWHAALSQERLKERNKEARMMRAGATTQDAYEAANRALCTIRTQQALRRVGMPLTVLGDFVFGHGRTPDGLVSTRPCGRGLMGTALAVVLAPVGCAIGGAFQALSMVDDCQRAGLLLPAHLMSLAPKAALSGTGALLGPVIGSLWTKLTPSGFDGSFRNDSTLFLEPVGGIEPDHLFVSCDRYAFDLRELLAWLSDQTTLINPYTMKLFGELDRERLFRAAPEALGHLMLQRPLSPRAQRLVIDTVLSLAGDFTYDQRHATVALGTYIKQETTLSPEDRHTLEALGIHKEVMHLIEGGNCIHLWAQDVILRLRRMRKTGQLRMSRTELAALANADAISEVGVRIASQRDLWEQRRRPRDAGPSNTLVTVTQPGVEISAS